MDSFRQRINMMYMFTGLNEKEVQQYIKTRLAIVHCKQEVFSKEACHTLYTLVNQSIRTLNPLINKALIIGANQQKKMIGSEEIMVANHKILTG